MRFETQFTCQNDNALDIRFEIELQIMANPLHRSVLLDHELLVDGIVFHERKELTNAVIHEVHENHLSHLRSIGDKKYTINQVIIEGVVKEETTDTNLNDEEIEAFKEEWEEKWRPSIGEGSTGIMTTFFKKLDKFLRRRDY